MKLMTLREDWRRVVFRAWSIRLMLLAALLSAIELGMSILTSNPPISPTTFALIYAAVSFLAAVARLVQQTGITPGTEEKAS